ncbi:transposase [Escherichia coli]|nr:transposase [Escherichia coli]GDL65661.1 transposase [Escherichia coli]
MIDVLGPEKRRRRTTQEKIAIVQQSFEPGMTVSLVARQHGVAACQLFSAHRIPGGKSYCCGRRRTGRSCL